MMKVCIDFTPNLTFILSVFLFYMNMMAEKFSKMEVILVPFSVWFCNFV